MNSKYILGVIMVLTLCVSTKVLAQGPINDSLTSTPFGYSNDTAYKNIKSNKASKKDTSTFVKQPSKSFNVLYCEWGH